MLLMHANNREDIKEAYAGDIVALAGLKDTRTGDTLCDPQKPGDPRAHGVPGAGHRDRGRAEDQGRPGEDGHRAGQARCRGSVLPRLDRPGIGPDDHEGHGRTSPRHQGRHPARTFKVEANIGAPQVAYRETITQARRDRLHAQEADRRYGPVRARQDRRSSRASRARASCSRTKIVGGSVPKEYIPGVEKGLEAVMENGLLAGFPVIDFKVDADRRRVPRRRTPRVLAFEIAARAAFREACARRPVRSCSSRS